MYLIKGKRRHAHVSQVTDFPYGGIIAGYQALGTLPASPRPSYATGTYESEHTQLIAPAPPTPMSYSYDVSNEFSELQPSIPVFPSAEQPDGAAVSQLFNPQIFTQQPKYLPVPSNLCHLLIEQDQYIPSRSSSHYTQQPPINFRPNNEGGGVLLSDALHRPELLPEAWGWEPAVLDSFSSPKMDIRLHIRGYRAIHRQMNYRHLRAGASCPVTKAEFVKKLAGVIKALWDEYGSVTVNMPDSSSWCVGLNPRAVRFEDVKLLSLTHVSKASWQPELCIVLGHAV